MKLLLVPDKFKGSLTAQEVIEALNRGILNLYPDASIHSAVLSDGGDGFLDSVAHYTDSETVWCETRDPLGRALKADYLYDRLTRSAYIEMARTAGLVLLKDSERNPLNTSTFGTGLQIRDALERGAKKIFVGLGGSATNDAGMGIACALGYEFRDKNKQSLKPIGANLGKVEHIVPPRDDIYETIEIYAINDVNNPLHGKEGAAYVYAAQKGADEEQMAYLDSGLAHLALTVSSSLKKDYATVPGAGAAGGTAYGLMTFLGAEFIGGASFVLELAGVHQLLQNETIDFIITGEGKIDDQTLRGKLIHGILELGKESQIPVIGVCGALDAEKASLVKEGLHDVIEVRDKTKSLEYNMKNAAELVESGIYGYFKSSGSTY